MITETRNPKPLKSPSDLPSTYSKAYLPSTNCAPRPVTQGVWKQKPGALQGFYRIIVKIFKIPGALSEKIMITLSATQSTCKVAIVCYLKPIEPKGKDSRIEKEMP